MKYGASERALIQHVLGVIEERLASAHALGEDAYQDADFIRRRFGELRDDLDMAHDTIAELTDLLYGSEENPVPVEIRHAMRSRSNRLQPVRLHLGGIPRTVLVPSRGQVDPIAEARFWRSLLERYGEAE